VQSNGGGAQIPPTNANFDGNNIGESSSDGVFTGAPSDTNGDVGPNHYVQIVNSVFSIYSKDGTRLTGATPIDDLWASAPNAAEHRLPQRGRVRVRAREDDCRRSERAAGVLRRVGVRPEGRERQLRLRRPAADRPRRQRLRRQLPRRAARRRAELLLPVPR